MIPHHIDGDSEACYVLVREQGDIGSCIAETLVKTGMREPATFLIFVRFNGNEVAQGERGR